jgi:transcriptional antiterminator NusG
MEQQAGKRWYVLKAVSGKEKKVKEYIESEVSRLGLENVITKVLVPTRKVYQIRNGKKISKEQNYLPGYVLLEVNGELDTETMNTIKEISGVLYILGTDKGKKPVPMRQEEAFRLLGIVDELADQDEEIDVTFSIGETVKIIDGPFTEFIGTIEEINEERKKVTVMVKLFGKKTPVVLNFLQVEKI